MKRHSALIALLVVVMVGSWLTPAQAFLTHHTNYDHMLKLRMKEKWLLPPVQLPSGESAWILDFDRKLRPFTTGQMAVNIKQVDMMFQGTPFVTDSVSPQQANALTQLGMLAAMGHYAVVNADDVNVRMGAVSILGQLADIADHFKLGNLSSQYQRLATDVADPKFMGGPSPIVARYDATVSALFDWVAATYGVDGHWYFMLGNNWPGLYVLALHGDQLHTTYYLSILNDLFHSKPHLTPDIYTRAVLRDVAAEPERDSDYLAGVAYATMNHYIGGSGYYVSPRWPHLDSNWHRVYVP